MTNEIRIRVGRHRMTILMGGTTSREDLEFVSDEIERLYKLHSQDEKAALTLLETAIGRDAA